MYMFPDLYDSCSSRTMVFLELTVWDLLLVPEQPQCRIYMAARSGTTVVLELAATDLPIIGNIQPKQYFSEVFASFVAGGASALPLKFRQGRYGTCVLAHRKLFFFCHTEDLSQLISTMTEFRHQLPCKAAKTPLAKLNTLSKLYDSCSFDNRLLLKPNESCTFDINLLQRLYNSCILETILFQQWVSIADNTLISSQSFDFHTTHCKQKQEDYCNGAFLFRNFLSRKVSHFSLICFCFQITGI